MRSSSRHLVAVAVVLLLALGVTGTATATEESTPTAPTWPSGRPKIALSAPQPYETIRTPMMEVTGQLPEGQFRPANGPNPTLITVVSYNGADRSEVIGGYPQQHGAVFTHPDEDGRFSVPVEVGNGDNELFVHANFFEQYWMFLGFYTDIPETDPDPDEPIRGQNYQPDLFEITTPLAGDVVEAGPVHISGRVVLDEFGGETPDGRVWFDGWTNEDLDPDTSYSADMDNWPSSNIIFGGGFNGTVDMVEGDNEIQVFLMVEGDQATWRYTTVPVTVIPAEEPEPEPEPEPGVREYAALGDSYSAGEGLDPYLPGRLGVIEHEDCHRSPEGWPAKVVLPDTDAPALTMNLHTGFKFIACSSAVTENFDRKKQSTPYPGPVSSPVVPLQFQTLSPETDLVTWTIGGNDAGFGQIVKHCAVHSDCFNRPFLLFGKTILYLEDWVDMQIGEVQNRFSGIYGKVENLTDGNATVVVAGYPHLFAPRSKRTAVDCSLFSETERRDMNAATDTFNGTAKQEANFYDLEFVDVTSYFGDENGQCGALRAGDEYISGIPFADSAKTILSIEKPCLPPIGPLLVPGLVSLVKGDCRKNPGRDTSLDPAAFHPTTKGTDAYAAAVSDRIKELHGEAARNGLPVNDLGLPPSIGPIAPLSGQGAVPFSLTRAAGEADTPAQSLTPEEEAAVRNYELGTLAYAHVAPGLEDECAGAVAPDQVIGIQATGFDPASSVDVRWEDASRLATAPALGTLTAGDDGTVTAVVAIPADATGAAGAVTVSGTSISGHGRTESAYVGLASSDSECSTLARSTGQTVDTTSEEDLLGLPLLGGPLDSGKDNDPSGQDTPSAQAEGPQEDTVARAAPDKRAAPERRVPGRLGETGTDVFTMALAALALLGVGASLLAVQRRRIRVVNGK